MAIFGYPWPFCALTWLDLASNVRIMPTLATSSHHRARGRLQRKRNDTLIALRINAGLSREDLADKARCGRETVRLAEVSGIVPTPRIQFALARVFKHPTRRRPDGSPDSYLPLDIWPLQHQLCEIECEAAA